MGAPSFFMTSLARTEKQGNGVLVFSGRPLKFPRGLVFTGQSLPSRQAIGSLLICIWLTPDGGGEEEEAAANKPTHNQCNYGSPCVTSGTPVTSTSAGGGQTLKLVKYQKKSEIIQKQRRLGLF